MGMLQKKKKKENNASFYILTTNSTDGMSLTFIKTSHKILESNIWLHKKFK